MKKIIIACFSILSVISCGTRETQSGEKGVIGKIAFGSCGHEDDPQPILEKVAAQKPDLFIYLGDNIYGDTYSMDTLRMKYQMLGAKPEFQKLRASTPILATWDDHDFGWNDSGRHYPYKEQSKEIFLEFFGIADTSLLEHPGIYYGKVFPVGERKLQVIMLDMRTFRDNLLPYQGEKKNDPRFNYGLDYTAYTAPDSTLLGEDQWRWLETQLQVPADLRIIGSSTQFGITHNGYEAWANFPHEQQKMLELIRNTRANGVIFISGDVHYAEISKVSAAGLYPIYDVTASGITSTWDFATPNDNRIDGPIMENHFGQLTIDWDKPDPRITMEIIDVSGNVRISREISLSELMFRD